MTSRVLSNKKSLILFGLAAMLAVVSMFAYFTDRVTTNATVTVAEKSADITINPTDPNYPDDLSGKWAAVNAEALANYNPGDKVDLGFALQNSGSQALDIRETFFITSSVDLTEASPEFRLFKNAVQDAAGAWDGNNVVDVELINDNTIKYSIPAYVLSSEDETIDNAPVEVDKTYELIFNKASSNAFQAATCKVEYLVEAKQHSEDGPTGGWTTLETAEIQFGGQKVNVVPGRQ